MTTILALPVALLFTLSAAWIQTRNPGLRAALASTGFIPLIVAAVLAFRPAAADALATVAVAGACLVCIVAAGALLAGVKIWAKS